MKSIEWKRTEGVSIEGIFECVTSSIIELDKQHIQKRIEKMITLVVAPH